MEQFCKHCNGTGEEPNGWTLKAAREQPEKYNASRTEGTGMVCLSPTVVSPLHFNGSGHEKCHVCGGSGETAEWRREKARQEAKKRADFFISRLGIPDAAPLSRPDNMRFVTIQATYDNSDTMTDYFDSHAAAGPLFALAIIKKGPQRENIARKIINQIPELEKLEWKWHAENYSMGNGYYLQSEWIEECPLIKTYNGDGAVYRYEVRFDGYSNDILPSKWFKKEQPTTPAPAPVPEKSGVIIGEYKGHPTITLPHGKRGFTFGLAKAKAILDHIEDIKAFVEQSE